MPAQPSIRQVSPGSWKPRDTQAIALLKTPVSILARRFKLRFENDVDDLDYFKFAVVELKPAGQRLAFVARNRSPSRGIEVLADSQADPASTLAHFLLATGLRNESLLWTTQLLESKTNSYRQTKRQKSGSSAGKQNASTKRVARKVGKRSRRPSAARKTARRRTVK